MPTYEYRCDQCGKTLEVFHSIKDAPKKKCPHCGKLKLKRLLGTGAGVIFKGSGFYQTDYRSDSYKKAAQGDNGSPPAKTETPAPAAESKKETPAKPAEKKETKKTA